MRYTVNDYGVTVSLTDGINLAIAEASLVGTTPTGKPMLYFNRINVPNKMRKRGIGTAILKKLLEIIKQNDWALLCEINPYGDLSREQLLAWYKKHGFMAQRVDGYEELWFNL